MLNCIASNYEGFAMAAVCELEPGQVWRNNGGRVVCTVVRATPTQVLLESVNETRYWIDISKLALHWTLQSRPGLAPATELPSIETTEAEARVIADNALATAFPPLTPEQHAEIEGALPSAAPQGYADGGPNPLYYMSVPGYEELAAVLRSAYAQAANGKGKERHASGDTPFQEQPMATINRQLQSIDGFIYQAHKKSLEAKRLPDGRAQAELLGAINYLAGAVIALDTWAKKESAS